MPELIQLDEKMTMQGGSEVPTLHGGKEVPLTRKIALIHALESNQKIKVGQMALAYDLSVRLFKANGSMTVTVDEADLIKECVKVRWPMPGIGVPLERWIEGAAK